MDARTALDASTVPTAMDVDSAVTVVNVLTARPAQSAVGALEDVVNARGVLIAVNALDAMGALGVVLIARGVLDAKAVQDVVHATTVPTAQTANRLIHRIHCRIQVHRRMLPPPLLRTAKQ